MKKCMSWRNVLLIAALLGSSATHAYQAELHQQLTFLSAKQISRCMVDWQTTNSAALGEPLSALDVRDVVRANAARAKGFFLGRMFRWNYLDISQDDSDAVLGVFDTRFNSRFHDLSAQLLSQSPQRDRLEALGGLLSYLQDVSTPSRVVPVYTGRWWRFLCRIGLIATRPMSSVWRRLARPFAGRFECRWKILLGKTSVMPCPNCCSTARAGRWLR